MLENLLKSSKSIEYYLADFYNKNLVIAKWNEASMVKPLACKNLIMIVLSIILYYFGK